MPSACSRAAITGADLTKLGRAPTTASTEAVTAEQASGWIGSGSVPPEMAGNESGAVVVTGASTGIGRATALYLDKQGYRVFAGVRKKADADSLAEDGSDQLTPITIDVTKEGSIASAKQKVQRAV